MKLPLDCSHFAVKTILLIKNLPSVNNALELRK